MADDKQNNSEKPPRDRDSRSSSANTRARRRVRRPADGDSTVHVQGTGPSRPQRRRKPAKRRRPEGVRTPDEQPRKRRRPRKRTDELQRSDVRRERPSLPQEEPKPLVRAEELQLQDVTQAEPVFDEHEQLVENSRDLEEQPWPEEPNDAEPRQRPSERQETDTRQRHDERHGDEEWHRPLERAEERRYPEAQIRPVAFSLDPVDAEYEVEDQDGARRARNGDQDETSRQRRRRRPRRKESKERSGSDDQGSQRSKRRGRRITLESFVRGLVIKPTDSYPPASVPQGVTWGTEQPDIRPTYPDEEVGTPRSFNDLVTKFRPQFKLDATEDEQPDDKTYEAIPVADVEAVADEEAVSTDVAADEASASTPETPDADAIQDLAEDNVDDASDADPLQGGESDSATDDTLAIQQSETAPLDMASLLEEGSDAEPQAEEPSSDSPDDKPWVQRRPEKTDQDLHEDDGTTGRRPVVVFWRFYVTLVIMLVLAGAAALVYTYDSLVRYERSQASTYMQEFVDGLNNDTDDANALVNDTFEAMGLGKYESADRLEGKIKANLDKGACTYERAQEGGSKEASPVYVLSNSDGTPFLAVRLNQGDSYVRLGLLTITDWSLDRMILIDSDDVKSAIDHLDTGLDYNVSVADNAKVYVDDSELTEEDLTGDKVVLEGFEYAANFVDPPESVTYHVDGFYSEPSIKATDYDGNDVEFNRDGNTLQAVTLAAPNRTPDQLPADALGIGETWSKFMTADSALDTVTPFLIPGSELYNQATEFANGVDITFTAPHVLTGFSNEQVSDCIMYNDRLFSCKVHFVKNLVLLSGTPREDVFDNVMIFAYVDNESVPNPGWYLVNMQATG